MTVPIYKIIFNDYTNTISKYYILRYNMNNNKCNSFRHVLRTFVYVEMIG